MGVKKECMMGFSRHNVLIHVNVHQDVNIYVNMK